MATIYSIPPQANGVNSFGTLFSDINYTVKLAASTAASVAVPSGAAMGLGTANEKNKWLAVFSYDGSAAVYVSISGTAAVPAGATLAASGSTLNPPGKQVQTGQTISIISAGTPNVSISFFAIQE